MTQAQVNTLMNKRNRIVPDYSSDKCLHQLFEAQAAITPDAVAVSFENQQLSYGQLNERANRLAGYLIARGVKRETLVGICVERSVEMIVGLLAILKAGGAYVPLDSAYPKERLQFVLDDAQLALLLTQERLLERLPDHGAETFCLDRDWPKVAGESDENLTNKVGAQDLAYVIYTSGSTGRPKGVLVAHANVTRLFAATEDWFHFGPHDVWTMFHSYAFDFSVWELWGALLYGGRLVVVPSMISRTPESFYDLLRREQITVLNQTPSAFRQLMKVAETAPLPPTELSLRLVIFGGEALEMSSLRGWFEQCGDQRPTLVNMYGITETTVHVTYRPLRLADVEARSVIGAPIPDLQLYLLKENLQPVPEGEVGELYVGGAGVARGYLRRPELTAERFIADPFSNIPEARLYRSGDLARQIAPGEFEYVGRCDQQVKVRGFRIELGEIEGALSEHEAVDQCVVVVREATPGDQRLVAYVVLAKNRPLSDLDHRGTDSGSDLATTASLEVTRSLLLPELRSYLSSRLPDYMVPASFVVLDKLPLTANGKIDRLGLPAPGSGRSLATKRVAARNSTEESLVDIWADVLNLEDVSIEDDFFELGGHSILVAQVISRIRDFYKLEVPQRLLFENPTIAGLSRIIEGNGLIRTSQQLATIPRCSRTEALPISLQQEQVWFIEQLHPNNKSYNSQSTVRFWGQLDYTALKRSLEEIVRRHEVLRTTFPTINGVPVQIIQAERTVDLPLIDLEALPAAERETEAESLIDAQLQRQFDLIAGPLICWTLLRFGPNEHVLVHVEHHFVHDGWSFNILVGELIEIYKAFSQQQPSPLSELPIQYADFASWQRSWLKSAEAQHQLAYWTGKLTHCPTAIELPSDRPRQAVQSFHGSARRIELPPELCSALRTLSRDEKTTLFMTLFAAFVALLHRYTGAEDISIGSGVGNRCWREVEGLIGMFVNTLVLRTDVAGDPTYRELLDRVRNVTLEAYSNQSVPFNQVVEVLQPDRDLSRNPLFQVAFSFHDAPRPSLSLPGLKIGVTEALNNGSAKFDINIIVIPQPLPTDPRQPAASVGGMMMIWEYNSNLFNSTTIERMVDHYQRSLEAIVRDPEQRLSELPLLNDSEQKRLLVKFNDTGREYPRTVGVSQLFEKQVELRPEAPAVICGAEVVSYRDLNERANRLAHYLRHRGIGVDGDESLVGVMLSRLPDLIVALLAVLKAGAAYIPLDADDPDERLRFMIADAGVRVVLTEESSLQKLADPRCGLCLDREAAQIAAQNSYNLDNETTGESLAYVMYTSGSTGKPKGICIEHHCINRLVINTDYAQIMPADRVAQAANVSFDAATFEIWGALLNGAALILISKDVALSPQEFAAEIRQKEISTLFLTTALFNQIARNVPDAFSALKHLLFGGEAVEPHWVREVLAKGRPERLLHVYGPTETTTFASWHLIESVNSEATNVPIGKPLANTKLYVLNEQLKPVPIGVTGELYIGGDGVGRGYLSQPVLTAERFIADPFSTTGQRLYRTGDLVRQLESGEIEFLRRKDQQIKLRGFRIEPGEIETVIREHEAVNECVVILREDEPGEKRLVAYVVNGNLPEAANISELRGYSKQRLPEYMIPSAFVLLAELPLTPNGKIARDKLPPPVLAGPESGSEHFAPRTATEELLISIWAEVLKVATVGVNQDFFEIGGHSLLATQVVSRVRDCFKVELPLRDLFEEPTIAGLSSCIDAARRAGPSTETEAIVRLDRDLPQPLSFAQQRLWFLDQLEPGNTAYNIAGGFRLTGALEKIAVSHSLSEIVRRHEVLRTSFPLVNGRPVQSIRAAEAVKLPCHDLQGLTAAEFAAETQRLLKQEAERPFDLASGPLVRATLLVHTPQHHVLLLTMHHIVSDGWSLNLLLQEFAALYQAFVTQHPSPLAELPIQYADYAVWQRERLAAGAMEKKLMYWRRQLSGLTTLQLPTDRMRPPQQTFAGRRLVTILNPELTSQLKRLSQREGTTLFMTLLAAFAVLLARYSAQDDIAVGTPIAGRDRREVEELVGFFVNTLVLRTDLSGNPSFSQLLERVREVTLDAYANQEVPFERLVEELQHRRDLSRSPLFQVLFSLLNLPVPQVESAGLQVGELAPYSDIAKFDLSLTAREAGQKLELAFQFNTDLFEESTVTRMMRHFERLLESIVTDPARQISELTLLSEAERLQQLREWNNTATDYPRHTCIHSLFEEQALRSPRAIAVEFGETRVSYGELNERANQLAHYLQDRGVGQGSAVGVMLSRSTDLVVALLAVLKAGGAYVPFEVDYPTERLRFMLHDAGVQLLITEGSRLDQVPQGLAGICLDRDRQEIARRSDTNPPGKVNSEDLAYVMYTSGSMGQPKGIFVEHRSVVRLVRNTNYVKLDADEVLLQFAPVSFDASTFEIWGALLNGARLVIAAGERSSLMELSRVLQEKRVTTLWLTAGLFHLMVDEHIDGLKGVKQLLAGGDVLSVRHVKRVLDELPDCILINGYGPTENTTFTCCHLMRRGDELGANVPIGRPISNTQVYVLNEQRELVPLGVAGELYVGGDGVARGYVNQPALTAQRFLPDPFSDTEGARLYRTGDIVRWRPTGELEFIGRADKQVKLRGFRIELQEVETALSSHQRVSECVVVLRDDEHYDKRLVAYLVASHKHEGAPTGSELKRYLKRVLPDYMVPSVFVELAEMPLTANGKIDTSQLPAPDRDRLGIRRDYLPARTPAEELLVNIWADVLNIGEIGIADDFFELGGHSLLATQVVSRIRECFHVELPLRDLFEEPTIAGLGRRVEAARHLDLAPKARPIAQASRDLPLPLSFAQQRLWFLDQLEPQNTAYNISGALRLSGRVDTAAVAYSLNSILSRHEALRTSFPIVNGRPVQSIAPAGEPAILIYRDLKTLPEGEREDETRRLMTEEARLPFDLGCGPLLRGQLLSVSPTESLLLLTTHHIVSDGWSLNILLREFTAFYGEYVTGQPASLSELRIQYGDYSVWQREDPSTLDMERKLAYWKKQLAHLTTVQLPTDRVRPPVQSFRGRCFATNLSASLTKKLRVLSRHQGTTLFMTLLAAFDVLLARYTGQADITVGSPIAGRDRTELEDLMGFFVNTVVLRADLSADPTFEQLLQSVRDMTLDAYANQDVPFERLVEELQPLRDLSRSPLFQIMFSLVNVSSQQLKIEGLEVQQIQAPADTSKFDLSLTAREVDDQIEIAFQYNTDLFDEATIARMSGRYELLLEAVVLRPEQRVSSLDLLTDDERRYLEVECNQTAREYSAAESVTTLFEQQVERSGKRIAVKCGGEQLSYRELNQRANQLAHYLRHRGVGPEVLVGVLLDRSVEMVVALLGVLKAGGAYVPLDPQLPGERLAFVVADARAKVLVTDEALAGLASLPAGVEVVRLDLGRDAITRESGLNLSLVEDPKSLAYVIYTSGSTGKPKGVMIERRSLTNLLAAMQAEFGLTENDVLLAVTTLAFDIAEMDIYLPLLVGAKLVLARRDEVVDVQQLRELPKRSRATMMQATPTLWRMLVDTGWIGNGALKILCGGEVLSRQLSCELLERGAALWNGYGPTETTIYSSMHRVNASEALKVGSSIPVGRPVANTQLFVVDKHLRLVPPGMPGELLIGGDGVGRGYLNQPALTNERFIEHSFNGGPLKRLYRTGDCVRMRANGELEYLGRLDQQVKIRGHRIETGEIEAVLTEHREILRAAVVVREDVTGDKRLVCYVVPAKTTARVGGNGRAELNGDSNPAPISAWRSYLLARLPEYMVPSVFETLDALPLTSSGKVDYRRLPLPMLEREPGGDARLAPQNDIEQRIADIWLETLRVDQVGRYDNFFDLGGNSMLMAQVQNRLQKEFDRDVAMVELFRYPTINCLAEFLSREELPRSVSKQALRRAVIRLQAGRRNLQPKEN
jgi:amino acid adenylation domain-containing protein